MDRRRFLERTTTVLARAALAPALRAAEKGGPGAPGGRLVLPMNRNWRFSPKADPRARARDFDDSGRDRNFLFGARAARPAADVGAAGLRLRHGLLGG